YVFMEDNGAISQVWDTVTSTSFPLAIAMDAGAYFSWKPEVNTDPPYQFVYTFGDDLFLGSLYGGTLGPLPGASDPNVVESMASWGPGGRIAFVRSTGTKGTFNIEGSAELYLIDEGGGIAVPVDGASDPDALQY